MIMRVPVFSDVSVSNVPLTKGLNHFAVSVLLTQIVLDTGQWTQTETISFSVLTVPLTKVLNHFSPVQTQIVLDTVTHRQKVSHLPVASLFLKGLPPKQPEGFGCFVCPN